MGVGWVGEKENNNNNKKKKKSRANPSIVNNTRGGGRGGKYGTVAWLFLIAIDELGVRGICSWGVFAKVEKKGWIKASFAFCSSTGTTVSTVPSGITCKLAYRYLGYSVDG